jgi:hypothetical protein
MKNIHLVPTDKPSRLILYKDVEFVLYKNIRIHKTSCETYKNHHIYITSDEEIKEGDWFIHPDSSCFDKECKEVSIGGYEILRVIKVDENFIYHSAMMAIHKNKNIKKIILTTDPDLINDGVQAIDDEFLEWFVKNPSCEWVEINKEYLSNTGEWKEVLLPSEWEVDTKVRYKIIIPQEEPKQAPFLEADKIDGEWLSPVPEERAWQEENLKKIFESYPNGFPKWSYLNGLILLGLKRIEIINKKNQNIDDLEEPKQETLEETGEFHFEKQVSNPYPTGTVAYTAYEKGFDNGAKWQANRLYSEEEVRLMLSESFKSSQEGYNITADEIIKQHKKK